MRARRLLASAMGSGHSASLLMASLIEDCITSHSPSLILAIPIMLTLSSQALVGDTFYSAASPVPALPGFAPAKPMVFASLYPIDTGA